MKQGVLAPAAASGQRDANERKQPSPVEGVRQDKRRSAMRCIGCSVRVIVTQKYKFKLVNSSDSS